MAGLMRFRTTKWRGRRVVAANFNKLIMLRVKEPATAQLLTSQVSKVHAASTIMSTSVSDPKMIWKSAIALQLRHQTSCHAARVNHQLGDAAKQCHYAHRERRCETCMK